MSNTNQEKILAVPTNIITGFLGVGKTSAIMHLLTQKPKHERWAVLVNEFGEIGVDGSLFTTSNAQNNIFIEEVSGGCMCCASGVPMQIALNRLLTKAKPHRLLIEPTGLGHPHEVLQLLSNQHYRDVLHIKSTVTLVDARNLSDKRYTEHETFNQQIDIADVVVGNKSDLYSEQDQTKLKNYLAQKSLANKSAKQPQLYFSEYGKVSLDWLSGLTKHKNTCESHAHSHEHHHKPNQKILASNRPFPASGIIRANNKGEGFKSVGWRFSSTKVFHKPALLAFLNSLNVTRVKAVFITSEGTFSYNKADNALTEISLSSSSESRIEIIYEDENAKIGENISEQWESLLIETINQ